MRALSPLTSRCYDGECGRLFLSLPDEESRSLLSLHFAFLLSPEPLFDVDDDADGNKVLLVTPLDDDRRFTS